jgi:2,4-diketo-3-deoxy-L-fuconate hydrolase
MRLVRLGPPGEENPAVLVSDTEYVDVSDITPDFDGAFFAGDGLTELRGLADQRAAQGRTRPLAGTRVGAPIARPHQIVCIGLNYVDHARETGADIPAEPVVFSKPPNTLVGPHDDVLIPLASEKTDWEIELGVVISRRASYLRDRAEARDAIAGYVLVNDVSERAFQLERGGQWIKGKSAPTFNPTGPWMQTSEDFDPAGRRMWLRVNDHERQNGNTRDMIFDPAFIVHYLSQFMALEPGDLINTGTPAGVGLSLNPPEYLRPGDVVELGIDGLGRQCQTFLQTKTANATTVQR